MAILPPTFKGNSDTTSENTLRHGVEAALGVERYFPSMRRTLIGLGAIGLFAAMTPSPASAVTGQHNETFTVSKSAKLKPGGEFITVTGEGFDTSVGIYVALCVINKNVLAHKAVPTPCGGGADETGKSGASLWISSNPPTYGIGLATAFTESGGFKKKLKVGAMIGKVDCRKKSCAIAVRADHTRGDDRSYDIFIPVTFQAK
jgi:hypothetical protein